MFGPAQRTALGSRIYRPVSCIGRLASCLLLAGCAAGNTRTTTPPDIVRSHIYPLPLDNVLAQTATLLQKKGWTVKRGKAVLVTDWQSGGSDTFVSYRIVGQRIDAGLCALRVEQQVATLSTSFNLDHPVTELDRKAGELERRSWSGLEEEVPNAGTGPPANWSGSNNVAQSSPWVVSQHRRDANLEQELQREIDPTPVATGEPEETPSAPTALVDAARPALSRGPATPPPVVSEIGPVDTALPATQNKRADMAGIWDGTFTFRGTVVGSFSGEVTVAVDGRTVEVDDFCPERGGTLAATGANTSAAWEGSLTCSAIPISGCPTATLPYSFAHATMNDSTLTMVAAGTVVVMAPGTVDVPPGCIHTGGALSTTFVAKKADYVHIAVTKVKRPTSCVWPSDWEDLNQKGRWQCQNHRRTTRRTLGLSGRREAG
jgi:hypothetical protein